MKVLSLITREIEIINTDKIIRISPDRNYNERWVIQLDDEMEVAVSDHEYEALCKMLNVVDCGTEPTTPENLVKKREYSALWAAYNQAGELTRKLVDGAKYHDSHNQIVNTTTLFDLNNVFVIAPDDFADDDILGDHIFDDDFADDDDILGDHIFDDDLAEYDAQQRAAADDFADDDDPLEGIPDDDDWEDNAIAITDALYDPAHPDYDDDDDDDDDIPFDEPPLESLERLRASAAALDDVDNDDSIGNLFGDANFEQGRRDSEGGEAL